MRRRCIASLQVYLATSGGSTALHVLLFSSPAGISGAEDAGEAAAAPETASALLAALPSGADAAAAAAALRHRFGSPQTHVAHAAGNLAGSLAAAEGSVLRLTHRGSSFLLWRAAPRECAALAALWRAQGARFALLGLALALAASQRSFCAGAAAASGACATARALLPPVVALFLAVSLLRSPLGRAALAAVSAAAQRRHAD